MIQKPGASMKPFFPIVLQNAQSAVEQQRTKGWSERGCYPNVICKERSSKTAMAM